MTDCYQCKIKPAVEGKLFPFCSVECHEKWNADKPVPKVKNLRSIQEMQRIITTEWKSNAKPEQPKTREEFEIAQQIFG